MFCTQCGSQNEENSKFCDTCGAPLENTQQDNASAQNESQEAPTQAISYQNSYPTNQPYANDAQYFQANVANYDANADKNKKRIIITVISAIVACVLVIGGGVWWYVNNEQSAKARNQAKLEQTKKKPKKHVKEDDDLDSDDDSDSSDDSDSKENEDNSDSAISAGKKLNTQKITNLIKDFAQNYYVSVAISDKNKIVYETNDSHTQFPAVGFYFPVILHAQEVADYNYEKQYENVIKTMSNASANELIDAQGGLDGLNDWLYRNDYSDTSFERKFGDVNAAKAGNDNYTSAHDAAMMLSKAMGNSFITNPTGYNIAADGVRIPSGITIMAHRGQGIKNVYNYFMIIKSGDKMLGMSVLTSTAPKSDVAELVSKLLDLLKNDL